MSGKSSFPEYERIQYELLLTVADVAEMCSSLEAKRRCSEPFTIENRLYDHFSGRAQGLLQRLAYSCALLGMANEYCSLLMQMDGTNQQN